MKTWAKKLRGFGLALGVLCALMFGAMPGVAQSKEQTPEKADFQIEIQAEAQRAPKFTVTNLTNKTLTACYIEFWLSSEGRRESSMLWDAIVQANERQPLQIVEPGASLTLNLPHRVGGPLPDRIQITAGVWADGETFGDIVLVKQLLDARTALAASYERAIAYLQQGMDEHWTREQYLAGLNSKPNALPFYAMRSTFEANRNADEKVLQLVARDLQAHFTKTLKMLQAAKRAGAAQSQVRPPS